MQWVNAEIAPGTVAKLKSGKLLLASSVASKVSFLNPTKSLRKVASQEFIHGPIDWGHFNKRGYEALSTDIAQVFFKPDGGVRTDNCIY